MRAVWPADPGSRSKRVLHMSDLVIVNATLCELAKIVHQLCLRTGNPDLAGQIHEQLDRMIEILELEQTLDQR
jgi:hypothetical protein